GDYSKHVDEGVSVSSPKDGQVIVVDAGATGSIPEALEGDQTNKIQNDDDVPLEKSSEHTPSPQDFGLTGDFAKSLPIVTPLKVQRPHDGGSYSSIDRSVQKSIENYSSTDEDIKNELGEEVEKNVMEDVGSTKMEQVSVHNEEKKIVDDNNQLQAEPTEGIDSYNDLPVANCDIIVSRTLQLQRNKYLAELSDQERILADFLFYSEYKDVSILSIDENNPAVIQQNEELRHNLECSVLLDIVNPANLDIREEEKPGTPRRFWFNILPSNYINWLIDYRKKKEYIKSIIAEKEIDLEKAKDNPCYDTKKAEWLKDKQKMTYRESAFFCHVLQSYLQGNRIKRRGFNVLHHWNRRTIPFTWRSNQNDFDCGVYCIKAMELYDGWNEKKHPITTLATVYTKNLSRCHLAIDLVSYKENRRKQEVFKECALWSARKPFLIEQQKKRKDKEKHLENLRVKKVEKVFVEDEKIRKERERHEQE
ncbi:Protoheme IX farnesyltransferase, partial [Bienertia sinuspersici]